MSFAMYIQDWIDQAVRGIPVRAERNAARQELRDHYEDRLAALKSTGLDAKEAEDRALAAMGSARETGQLLRRVHKPWLTWALRITRVLLVLLLLAALGFFGTIRSALSTRLENRRMRDPSFVHSVLRGLEDVNSAVVVSRGEAKGSGSFGSRPMTLTEAWTRLRHVEEDVGRERVTYETGDTFIFLRIPTPFWIKPDLQTIQDHTTVSTEEGEQLLFDCLALNQSPLASEFCILVYEYAEDLELRLHCDAERISFDYTLRFGPREDLNGWLTGPAPTDEAAFLEALGPARMEPFRSGDGYVFQVLRETSAAAEPQSAGALELSVPWMAVRTIERTALEDAAEEPLRFAELDFVLELRGPWEKLFLTPDKLSRHLTLRDTLGREEDSISCDWSGEPAPRVFRDRGYYRFYAEMPCGEETPAWYELVLETEDGPITLRLTPTEEGR